ncbi:MAG: glycosyltransferase family 4 protein [Thiocapsa sp.]|uniref:glycosyltransferase family 4 protein n=1 Tax=Thiocapsa sp. TaxID=2024551 RepID=UPI001BD130AC|nr:glycosyltransferase family 4 protein [Thiocapsa sp.]QVL50290.1 MAG: glycosyltransferase family 4 protein [Thiocapsa sp.]
MKPTVVLFGPSLSAVSGVSTHLNQLFGSAIASELHLLHFQVGSEGKAETALTKLARFLWSPFQLAIFLCRRRPDIVHLNSSLERKAFWRDFVYLLVSRLCRRPVVLQIHGGYLPEVFCAGSPILSAIVRRALSMTETIVLLAESERVAYSRFVPGVHIRVVANAIDVGPSLAGAKADLRRGENLKLVYVGRLATEKGISEAIEAIDILRREGVDVSFKIAGAGPAEGELRDRVSMLGLADRVQFLGAVFGDDKDDLWLEADVFVFPTFHVEGLPYALLESMAARTIPVTCPVGGIPDVMQDEVHGLFVPPHEPAAVAAAILWIHENRAAARAMGEAARDRILDAYTVTRLADDFRSIYNEVLGATCAD